jgi:putative flippase GtrA
MSSTTLSQPLKITNPVSRLARFLTVGALGTALDVGVFTALHSGLGLAALPANLLSYSLGIANNYSLHRRWTYADRPAKRAGVQLLQFLVVSLSALALNTALVMLLSAALTPLTPAAEASLLAKLGATGAGLAWNFLINHFWTFRVTAERGPQ